MNPPLCTNITVRKSQQEDAEQVLIIYNDSNRIFPKSARLQGDIGLIHEVYGQNTVLVAENCQQELTGWLAYRENESGYGEINGLYVLQAQQRRGIGQILLNSYMQIARQHKITLIYLKALKNAPWSVQFYQKNGFVRCEPISGYFSDPCGLSVKVEPWEILMIHFNIQ